MASSFLSTKPSEIKPFGKDGSNWIVEAHVHGKYLKDSEWSPQKGDLFQIAKAIAKACNLPI